VCVCVCACERVDKCCVVWYNVNKKTPVQETMNDLPRMHLCVLLTHISYSPLQAQQSLEAHRDINNSPGNPPPAPPEQLEKLMPACKTLRYQQQCQQLHCIICSYDNTWVTKYGNC
jgi:hypothetical protein